MRLFTAKLPRAIIRHTYRVPPQIRIKRLSKKSSLCAVTQALRQRRRIMALKMRASLIRNGRLCIGLVDSVSRNKSSVLETSNFIRQSTMRKLSKISQHIKSNFKAKKRMKTFLTLKIKHLVAPFHPALIGPTL